MHIHRENCLLVGRDNHIWYFRKSYTAFGLSLKKVPGRFCWSPGCLTWEANHMNCWTKVCHSHLQNFAMGCLFKKGSVPCSLRNKKQEKKGKRGFRYNGESRDCAHTDKGISRAHDSTWAKPKRHHVALHSTLVAVHASTWHLKLLLLGCSWSQGDSTPNKPNGWIKVNDFVGFWDLASLSYWVLVYNKHRAAEQAWKYG